jgi:hypothetical protein
LIKSRSDLINHLLSGLFALILFLKGHYQGKFVFYYFFKSFSVENYKNKMIYPGGIYQNQFYWRLAVAVKILQFLNF